MNFNILKNKASNKYIFFINKQLIKLQIHIKIIYLPHTKVSYQDVRNLLI